MKNIVSIIIYILLLTASSSAIAESHMKKKHKVDVKCHVELTGGKEIIYFARVKEKHIKKLFDTLPNRKVLTSISKDKQRIHQVFECAPLKVKFISPKANRLFESQPR